MNLDAGVAASLEAQDWSQETKRTQDLAETIHLDAAVAASLEELPDVSSTATSYSTDTNDIVYRVGELAAQRHSPRNRF